MNSIFENKNSLPEFSYILLTPCKNEEENLPGLIKSIANQVIKPKVWVIVDDCSNDTSANILEEAIKNYSWIHNLKLRKKSQYNLDEHYSKICNIGFCYAFKQAKKNNHSFEYIALSDADMIYPKDYFYQLIRFLQENEGYGIVSGNLLILDSKKGNYEIQQAIDEFKYPLGTGRVWRKKTFEETGGYLITKAPDTVSNIKAILKGWKITQLSDVKYYQTRETGGKENLWKGYLSRGERAYYLNENLLSVINTVICNFTISKQKYPFKKSLAYLCGYISSFIRRKDKIEDVEVKFYVGSYKNVLYRYKVYLKHFLKSVLKSGDKFSHYSKYVK